MRVRFDEFVLDTGSRQLLRQELAETRAALHLAERGGGSTDRLRFLDTTTPDSAERLLTSGSEPLPLGVTSPMSPSGARQAP